MKTVVILTASDLRHDYFKIKFSSQEEIKVLKTYCHVMKNKSFTAAPHNADIESVHFSSRRQVEKDFF